MTPQPSDPRIWTCRALTDIWTGDANGKPERLITTGLLGSIRWWFEVLVRGLGGSACDPSNTKCQGKKHCVVCELFGCTGWARKFRFDVLGEDEKLQQKQIQANRRFHLRFTPLRPIADEEWALLDVTIRLIAEYGAIGGKTVFKPTDERDRMHEIHHQDFGILEIVSPRAPEARVVQWLRVYVQNGTWQTVDGGGSEWASLQNFWFVEGRHLARKNATDSSFNKVLGRHESKKCRDCGKIHDPPQKCQKTGKHPRRHSDGAPNENAARWLAGGRGESKKVFSFKDPARTFGFINPNPVDVGFVNPDTVDVAKITGKLKQAWPELRNDEILTGDTILARLLSAGAGRP